MKRLLINATQHEELRVAIVDGQKLVNLDIESIGKEQKKSNIYLGVVTRIEPSLEAAFVDYGAKRHGFLSVKDVASEYFVRPVADPHARLHIKDILKEDQELLVQVEKEERGSKGAALTTFISLAGCYLVLVPNNPRAGGISKRVEGEDRSDLREILENLALPEGMGLIARTASAGRSNAELSWDLQALVERWKTIQEVAKTKRAPLLIHQESGVIIRAVRDHLREDITEILVDDPDVFNKTREYIRSLRPDYVNRIKLYRDTVPLFNRYQIEGTIESAFQREVKLPSGGALVIDRTEALVSIDINSSKATKGIDIEETAFNTNLEAAEEIARQLRLRDLAGLIVIDFIDMSMSNHQREVENRLRDALHDDRARVQIGRISRFGLLEMSRQRLGPTLSEAIEDICPTCQGHGTIRGVASSSLATLRSIEEEAIKENTAQIQVQLPVEVATYILNEKRKHLAQIEQKHQVEIVIIPNQYMVRPNYTINRLRQEEVGTHINLSYKLVQLPGALSADETPMERRAEPVLKDLRTTKRQQHGLIKRIFSSIFGEQKEESVTAAETPAAEAAQTTPIDRRNARSNDRPRGQQRQRRSSNSGGRTRRQNPVPEEKLDPANMSDDARLQQKYAAEIQTDTQEYKQTSNREERPPRTERTERGQRYDRHQRNDRTRHRRPHANNESPAERVEENSVTSEIKSAATDSKQPSHTETASFQKMEEMLIKSEVNTLDISPIREQTPVVKSEEIQREIAAVENRVQSERHYETETVSHSHKVRESFADPIRDNVDETTSISQETLTENSLENSEATDNLQDGSEPRGTQQRKRRPQRPYRGPGRRRPRDQHRKPSHSHSNPTDDPTHG